VNIKQKVLNFLFSFLKFKKKKKKKKKNKPLFSSPKWSLKWYLTPGSMSEFCSRE
jgi:hypothetical protein